MKYYLLTVLSFLLIISVKAADKDSTVNYNLPDSVKAVQFMVDIQVKDFGKKKSCRTGIKTNTVILCFDNYFNGYRITFYPLVAAAKVVYGINVHEDLKYGYPEFHYKWKVNETYKLLISQAVDSAGNFSLYSGYIFLPAENKWKLIATYKTPGRWHSIQQPASFYVTGKKYNTDIITGQVWVQRNNGSWKNMKVDGQPNPVVNLFGHIDSIEQRQIDKKKIEDAIAAGKTDAIDKLEGLYYKMIKEGTGKQVSLNDTVTINYRLSLFNDTTVIQETKDKPATFPLKRLIRGWQIGVPLCKVGGKIKLVIPSDLAYSIRTRAADIPPNSILVFEIEVLDAKSPDH
jgi:hypothetical protein